MKYLIKIERCFYFILVFGFFHTNSSAQNLLNKHYLSDDIQSQINSNPDQALKIAQYLLSKTSTANDEKAKVNYLISKAYIVKGDYSSALNFLYEEKDYGDYLNEEKSIDIDIAKIRVLRELSLDKQSKKIIQQLEDKLKSTSDSKLKKYLETSIAIEKANYLLKENKSEEGISLLKKQESSANETLKTAKELELNYLITKGQLFLATNDLAQAEKSFQSAIDKINKQNADNIYSKIDALNGLANVLFLKKEYNRVVSLANESMIHAERLKNLFLQLKISEIQSANYLALNDFDNYKKTNTKFFELQTETEAQEQEAINTSYNLISDEYTENYENDEAKYYDIIYIFLGLVIIAALIGFFFWQKTLQRKKRLDEIINYIEITRSNLLGGFSIADKKQEPKKHVILKETEEQILNKLKRFESSKRFTSKDISLAVLAGQLDSNTKYLSEIINNHYHVNFNTYINKLRINYIIEKLKNDPNFINYKISYLAENCGFSSHSSFATVFKSITGISPVKFIELLNQEKENNLLEE